MIGVVPSRVWCASCTVSLQSDLIMSPAGLPARSTPAPPVPTPPDLLSTAVTAATSAFVSIHQEQPRLQAQSHDYCGMRFEVVRNEPITCHVYSSAGRRFRDIHSDEIALAGNSEYTIYVWARWVRPGRGAGAGGESGQRTCACARACVRERAGRAGGERGGGGCFGCWCDWHIAVPVL